MSKYVWSLLTWFAVGCAGETPPPAAPPPAPVSPTAGSPAESPALAAASTPGQSAEIPVTSKAPQAIDEFKQGRDQFENMRRGESIAHFKKAIELDPTFSQAHAYLGFVTPGPEGLAELEKAAQLAVSLPEAEKVSVEAMLAQRRGDSAKVAELEKKLVQLAPGDWRSHWYLGMRASMQRHWEDASSELRKAVELNPKGGAIYNNLGYAFLMQGKKDEAIAAFKNYVEAAPKEPNAHDSLGDALLAASRLEEAEAEYKKALEIAPQFWFAWTGVAATRSLRSDWKGAYEALGSAAKAAPRPEDRLEARLMLGWTQFAEGKSVDAIQTITSVEKDADSQKQGESLAIAGIDRAAMLLETGKPKDAVKRLEEVTARAEKDALPGEALNRVRRIALVVRATSEEKLGKKDDLAKTLASLQAEVRKVPDNAGAQSQVEYVEGLVALAGGDAKGGAAHFSKCVAENVPCKVREVMALEKAGDKAGAGAAKQKIVDTPTREPLYLYGRAKLGTIPKPKK